MRTLKRNRQKMFYSLAGAKAPVYELDEEGNIVYIEIDGVMTPVETGEFKTSYSKPEQFWGTLASQLENAIVRAWGNDSSNNYAVLIVGKHELDFFENGTRIWLYSPIRYNADGTVNEDSADYEVAGIMREELHETSFYLQVLNTSTEGTVENE